MQSAAAAFAWSFRRRYRWGLAVAAAYFAALAILRMRGQPIVFADEQSFAFATLVPISATFLYFLAIFTFGLDGDIAGRQSMYPARMFTLPVGTSGLAGWPMLYGSVLMAVLWLAARFLAAWPPGGTIPVIWPALLAASLLAWTQALTWMSYPLRGLRVIVTVLWLSSFDAIVLIALHYRARESVMLAILAPHVPLAFLVARRAVARARRGDVPDWRGGRLVRPAALATFRGGRTRASAPPTPTRAQLWLEWRQHGRSLPALVAIVVPFELTLLFVFPETPVIVMEIVIGALGTPALLAVFVGAAGNYTLTSFQATKPLSNLSLLTAKLKVTLASCVAAWLFIAAVLPLALKLSSTTPIVIKVAHDWVSIFGKPRAIVLASLIVAALFFATWKQLIQSLYLGMSGRAWLVKANVFGALTLLGIGLPLLHWIRLAAVVNALHTILAIAVALKMIVAAMIVVRLHRDAIVSDRILIGGAAIWNVLVFAIFALLVWNFPLLVRPSLLMFMAILSVPLARLAAAPLALDRNRHA